MYDLQAKLFSLNCEQKQERKKPGSTAAVLQCGYYELDLRWHILARTEFHNFDIDTVLKSQYIKEPTSIFKLVCKILTFC